MRAQGRLNLHYDNPEHDIESAVAPSSRMHKPLPPQEEETEAETAVCRGCGAEIQFDFVGNSLVAFELGDSERLSFTVFHICPKTAEEDFH